MLPHSFKPFVISLHERLHPFYSSVFVKASGSREQEEVRKFRFEQLSCFFMKVTIYCTASCLFGSVEGRVLSALPAPFSKYRCLCFSQGKIFGFQSIFYSEENTHSLCINGLQQLTTNSSVEIFCHCKSHLSGQSIFFF